MYYTRYAANHVHRIHQGPVNGKIFIAKAYQRTPPNNSPFLNGVFAVLVLVFFSFVLLLAVLVAIAIAIARNLVGAHSAAHAHEESLATHAEDFAVAGRTFEVKHACSGLAVDFAWTLGN